MAFHHSTTFLRSALARDPFCHGDLISAEDVIRMEAKFPTLFDKPPSIAESASERALESDDFFLTASPIKAKSTISAEKVLPRKHPRSSPGSAVTAKPRVAPGPPKRKPIICKYHEKCFTGGGDASEAETFRKPNEKLKASGPTKAKAQSSLRMLNKPSISLEDLRLVLKQVLEEEQRPKNFRRPGTRSLPSPYTEDLVKKFFGKKMEEMKRQKQKSQSIKKRKEESQAPANTKPRAKPVQASPTKKVTSRKEHHPSTDKLEPKVQRVGSSTSAPGFIRVKNELPRAPPPKLGVTYQNKRTDSGLLNISGNSSPRVAHKDEHARQSPSVSSMGSDWRRQEVAENCSYHQETTEESNFESDFPSPRPKTVEIVKPAIIRDTRVIHLTCPKHLVKSETSLTRHELRYPLPKSRYNQLLAAHQATGNLETKAMLRKQERFDRKIVTEQIERMKHSYYSNGSEEDDSPNQIVNRFRHQVERRTSDTLEKIAEELVYTEILHHLSELKLEQETRQRMFGGPSYSKSQSNRSQAVPSDSEQNEKLVKIPSNSTLSAITENESQKESEAVAVIKTPEQVPASPKVEETSQIVNEVNSENKVLPRFIPMPTAAEREDESGDETGASISDAVLRTPVSTPGTTNDRKVASTPDTEREKRREKIHASVIPTTVDTIEEEESNVEELGDLLSEAVEPAPAPAPTSAINRVVEIANDETDESIVSLQTSQLSPKNPKNETLPPQQIHTELDEMSDFTISQPIPSPKEESEEEQEVDSVKEIEILKSPQSLANSVPDILNPPELNDNAPENDESTMSGISTFSDSHRQLKVKSVNDEDDEIIEEEKIPSKYSDDFIPEVGSNCNSAQFSSTLTPPVNNPSKSTRFTSSSVKLGLMDTDSENEDVIENLNTSRETVIDLLSEGEFVGEVNKSPGELSLRHHLKAPAEKLVFPKHLLSEEVTSLKSVTGTSDYEESNGEVGQIQDEKLGEYEISHISEGVHLAADRSWGKSVGEL